MKILLYIFATFIVVTGLMLVALSIASRKLPELGLENDKLRACPITPNCVCSEFPTVDSYIEPLVIPDATIASWAKVKQALEKRIERH